MLSVLLIEDDEVDAENIKRLLGKCEFANISGRKSKKVEFTHVQYFQKGLEFLEKNSSINLILLDLNLPDGGGKELVIQLQNAYKHVPLVVLTGQDPGLQFGVEIISEGAQDYLPKDKLDRYSLERCIKYSMNRHHLSKMLNLQAEELKLSNEELETFTYIASHDLRSPLLNLKGFSVELEDSLRSLAPILEKIVPQLSDEEIEIINSEVKVNIPKALDFISNSVEKMDRLTGAIMKLSQLGRRELVFEEIETFTLVSKCVKALNYGIEKLKCQVHIEEMPNIFGDRMAIEQIFGNLLDNAVKFLSSKRKGKISISFREDPAHYIFSVQDNGRGINQEDHHKVFEIFRRAENVDEIPGEGMGMSYVRALVKRHGGNIWFKSIPGQGTTFIFSISKDLES